MDHKAKKNNNKILQVTGALGGGVLTSISQICNALASMNYEVHLAYSLRADSPAQIERHLDRRVITHEINMPREIKPFIDIKSIFEVLRLITELDPWIIHLHSSKAGFIGRIAAFLMNKSKHTFYSPRGLAFLRTDISNFSRLMYIKLEKLGNIFGKNILACSRGELDAIRECFGVHQARLLENAVDISLIPEKKTESKNRVLIGTMGRVTWQKNPSAFARLASRKSLAGMEFLWIGGAEPDTPPLLDGNKIKMTGWLDRKSALARLAELDIYVQASLWEGMPLTVIEAMVAGIPVVVTDVVGNRDVVVQGETGFVAKDENELAHYVEKLAQNPVLRKKMGRCARELAIKRFSLERLIRELVEIYHAVG